MEQQESDTRVGSSSQPFWERYGICTDRGTSEEGCSYTSFINVRCRLEGSDKNDRPTRKCERLVRKFRDCGRGKEEIESTAEEVIDHNYKPGKDLQDLRDFSGSSQPLLQGAPLDAHVGEALEEFVEYAERLKLRAAGVSQLKQGFAFDNQVSSRQGSDALTWQHEPWYSRFFQRRAQCSPGRQRPWENFKEDFQEV